MNLIDRIHTRHPFKGSRRIRDDVVEVLGKKVNRKRVQRLMRVMGIIAIYPKPKTTKPGKGPEHKVFPYLLRGVEVTRPNQVWATDITYLPMARGFAYLVAIMDVYSRRILSWRLSNTMDTRFCVDALEEAMERFGKPEIFNSDQGSQFTSNAFTSVLLDAGIKVSMNGRGSWRDNVFAERFWWTLKFEEVYLRAYDDVREAREFISNYMRFYNTERKHSSLEKRTPVDAYERLALAAPATPPLPKPVQPHVQTVSL